MKTVLITGCSTGFGREIALHFLNAGWNVVATMRDPAASTLPVSDRLRVLPLDVTDAASIAAAVGQAGRIDVLVNNAGIGWLNAIEGTPLETARGVFETNLFGVMAMMQAVLPQMRARRSGVIINVGSSTIYKPLPLLSVYRASKAALTALTECAAVELAEFGITAKLVAPGHAPETSFASSALATVAKGNFFPAPYAAFAERVMGEMLAAAETSGQKTRAEDVAKAVYRVVTDPDAPTVLPAGADAITWAEAA